MHRQHQTVGLVLAGQFRRRRHAPGLGYPQQVGEPVPGRGEQAGTGDARAGLQRPQLPAAGHQADIAADPALQRLPPGAGRPGQQQHPHRQPDADPGVGQQRQHIGGVPPFGVIDHHQHPGRTLQIRGGEGNDRRPIAPVVRRQHQPPVLPPQPRHLTGQPALALPAGPVQQTHRRPGPRRAVPPGPQLRQLVAASGEIHHRVGRPQQLAGQRPHLGRRRHRIRHGPDRQPVGLGTLVHDHVPGGLEDPGEPGGDRVLSHPPTAALRIHRRSLKCWSRPA